jgi:hypothetical protein
MTREKKTELVHGARSIIEKGQTSFAERAAETRRGKHLAGSRKVADLPHVGASTPDADADPPPRRRAR